MVTCFWPKLMKCPKMGSKCQIFASLLARKTLLKEYYKEIPRNGVVQCIEFALSDLQMLKM